MVSFKSVVKEGNAQFRPMQHSVKDCLSIFSRNVKGFANVILSPLHKVTEEKQ